MTDIYSILGIQKTDAVTKDEIQHAYEALVARYTPDKHPEEIQALSLFLIEAEGDDREHRIYCLKALETIAQNSQVLPVATLEILAAILLNEPDIEIRQHCADVLAFSACYRLPDSALRALEHVLANDEESLSTIAASALSRAVMSGQTLAENSLQLAEAAFLRYENDRSDILSLLYALLSKVNKSNQSTTQNLSLTTYEELSRLIVDDTQPLRTQIPYYNIIIACARNGQILPGVLFEALAIAIENPREPIKAKAFYALMLGLASEQNRQAILPEIMTKIVACAAQSFLDKNENYKATAQHAACVLGHLVLSPANIPQDVLFTNMVENTLNAAEDPVMQRSAVLPLLRMLSQEKFKDINYGLSDDALLALAQMSTSRTNDYRLENKRLN